MKDEIILYQKMKAGDQSAFDEIFKMHYEQLVRFGHSKIGDVGVAEDIVQNIFINFWTKRATLNVQGALLPYLKKSVHNRCIDHFRKQQNLLKKEEQYFQNSLALSVSNPEEELLNQENLQAIHTKIEALPPKCKVVFKLSRFEEMSYAEIASHLDISIKTVEMHISTALRLLRKSIFISLLLFISVASNF